MTQSYSQIVRQIETLQRKASAARHSEIAGVVQRIKEAIKVYSLTAADLGLGNGKAPANGTQLPAAASAKFMDENGNTWGGRGPRPAWLRAALASGKSLDDFATGTAPKAAKKAGRKVAAKGKRSRGPVPAKYKDDAGNTWSGRGSRPRWLVAALAKGKTLESMSV